MTLLSQIIRQISCTIKILSSLNCFACKSYQQLILKLCRHLWQLKMIPKSSWTRGDLVFMEVNEPFSRLIFTGKSLSLRLRASSFWLLHILNCACFVKLFGKDFARFYHFLFQKFSRIGDLSNESASCASIGWCNTSIGWCNTVFKSQFKLIFSVCITWDSFWLQLFSSYNGNVLFECSIFALPTRSFFAPFF